MTLVKNSTAMKTIIRILFLLIFSSVFKNTWSQCPGYPNQITVSYYNSGGNTPVGMPTPITDPYFTNSGSDLCGSASTNGRLQTFNGGVYTLLLVGILLMV